MDQRSLPKQTLGRLPNYLAYLRTQPCGEDDYISATTIARDLGIGEVQVRKDLHAASGDGRPRVGYQTAQLIAQIENLLGAQNPAKAVLVGTGKLGRALLGYEGFLTFGIDIAAGFNNIPQDNDGKKPIYPMEQLPSYCRENGVRIGIITVPKDQAQAVADLLVANGITAIWSFAPVTVPKNVFLLQENLALSLAHVKTFAR